MATAYYPKNGSYVAWTPDMVGALGSKKVNGYYGMATPAGSDGDWIRTTSNGILPYASGSNCALGTKVWRFNEAWIDTTHGVLDGNAKTATEIATKATYAEKTTANVNYYQLGSITCTHKNERVSETFLCIARQDACIMNISTYSTDNTFFQDPKVSYTFLTPNAKATFYDNIYVGLDKKGTAGNTFSIWMKRAQYGESMKMIPLGANIDKGFAISWKSYGDTDAGSTTAPIFGQSASCNIIQQDRGNYAPSAHTHTKSQITDFPKSMPASDVYAWAKASTKPSYTKAEVGLGNVDNTADSAKSVKYATSAGSANAVAWGNVTDKPSTYAPSAHTHTKSQITDFPTSMPASDVYAWAKASSKPSYSWEEITSKPSTFPPSAHTHDYITVSTTQPTSSTCKIWIKP